MKLVQVWIEYTAAALDRPFTYACFDEAVERGKRVEVMFNRRASIGFVESVETTTMTLEQAQEALGYKLGVINKIIDERPLIKEELFAMAQWMAKETVSSHISCFQAMLPAKLKPQTNQQKIKMATWVQVVEGASGKLTARQQEALHFLQEKKGLLLSEWRAQFKSVGKLLEEKGLVKQVQKEAEFETKAVMPLQSPLTLTPLQQKAKEDILQAKQEVVLLHGVTGSGKTEVYLQLAQEVVQKKKQVLILVPEIALTPQMVKRVESRFGTKVAIYHSALNNQEKYEQFKRVWKGEVDVVVGTRSAVFMPFNQLGLIILDEEHDSSYKQDSTPQYHCRDAAIWRAHYHHCKVILGSATPSLDSYARTLKQRYHLTCMPERINKKMPVITTVSTQQAIRNQQSYILTDVLKEKIQERLDHHEQIMLMLNRRGYSPTIRCNSCGESLMCPHCDLALSYHRSENALKCHCCGYAAPLIRECPKCHSHDFTMLGVGTQRLVEEVEKTFPVARVIRMDADTTSRKNSHQKILEKIEHHEADILVGTQIIAKGIDYPDVTLVGIINGDAGLNRSDFRSVETTFQLIVQSAGRSGRATKPGEVVIQAYDPDHYAIQYGSQQDYLGFFAKEMNYRHLSNNPPYSYLISIVFSDPDKNRAVREIHQFTAWLKEEKAGKVLGPSELFKLQDSYRFRLVLKGKNRSEMIEAVSRCHQLSLKQRMKSRIKVDTSPMMLE